MSAGYAVVTMSLEPLQLFTVGVNGCSIHLVISHSESKESVTSDYNSKNHFRLRTDGSKCPLILEKNLGVIWNLFQQKSQMLYHCFVTICFHSIDKFFLSFYHKAQLILQWFLFYCCLVAGFFCY